MILVAVGAEILIQKEVSVQKYSWKLLFLNLWEISRKTRVIEFFRKRIQKPVKYQTWGILQK